VEAEEEVVEVEVEVEALAQYTAMLHLRALG